MKKYFSSVILWMMVLAPFSEIWGKAEMDRETKTEIAFLEVYDFQGRLIQYEPGSRFGHTALRVGELWLQSYPGEGVKFVTWEELQKRGKVAAVLRIPVRLDLSRIAPYLGRPFDFGYTWSDEALYCSELIAKILQIPPEPMQFNRDVWPPSYWPLEGQAGMSPDKIYHKLRGPGPYF